MPAKGTGRAEAMSPTREVLEQSAPRDNAALAASFGSASEPRDRALWNELCSTTDYETGQLRGDVGTPDDPLFTYEEVVRQRQAGQSLVLYVGGDIIPVEGGGLPEISERNLKKLRRQADETELPELPKGFLPGGWDALGRPWALMDCPMEKVPQIPSVRTNSRVTVAVLVSFPPEPFYFVDLVYMDRVIRLWNKAAHKMKGGMSGELEDDGMLKLASTMYAHLKLPGCGHSVPVQELLKEPRWSA